MNRLSPRMEQVVELVVAEGLSYRLVADRLELSESTIRSYAEQIGKRLGDKPKAAMARYYWTVMRPEEAA